MKHTFLICLLSVLLFSACEKSLSETAQEQDLEIKEYVDANNLDARRTSDGLYVIVDEEGNGEFPVYTSTVKVKYAGFLLDGTKFDSGDTSFNLQQVIQGWTLGIPEFSVGGKGQLIIPSHLAYGNREQGSIPANSILIFDIHLKDIL